MERNTTWEWTKRAVEMIPFGLLAGFYGKKEIRITKLAEEGFCFRLCTASEITKLQEKLKLCFYAFVLNELCHFTGAFCNSLHCDEMGYLCRVPYQLGTVKRGDHTGGEIGKTSKWNGNSWEQPAEPGEAEDGYLCGATGCGLCALYQLRAVGITHLKLVGRGNYTDFMEHDIKNLRNALEILEQADSEEVYQKKMNQALFSKGCSGNCYYRENAAHR